MSDIQTHDSLTIPPAAAPDLLAALRWMLTGHESGCMSPQIVEQARAAIVKADGV